MKLKLPSTWTSQKIAPLFLMTCFLPTKVKTGKNFSNCIAQTSNNAKTTNYNFLVNFPFNTTAINNGLTMILCCDSYQCFSKKSSSLCSDNNSSWNGIDFHCNKVNNSIVCVDIHGVCCGIVGDNPVTSNITFGTCSNSLTTVANYISTVNINKDNGYAYWSCPAGSPCSGLVCDWDNGGWTCLSHSSVNCKVDNDSNYVCDTNCNLQWIAPNPFFADVSSTSFSNIASSKSIEISNSISPTINVPSNNFPTNNSNLTIIIPVTIGVSALIISTTGCYFYKKRKKQTQQQEQENNQLKENLELPSNERKDIPLLPLKTKEDIIISDLAEIEAKNEQYLQKPESAYLLSNSDDYKLSFFLQFLQQIQTKLTLEDQELVDNLLDAQETLLNANERTLASAKRQFERAKKFLERKISQEEVEKLCQTYENEILQKTHEQYKAYVELLGSSRIPDAF